MSEFNKKLDGYSESPEEIETDRDMVAVLDVNEENVRDFDFEKKINKAAEHKKITDLNREKETGDLEKIIGLYNLKISDWEKRSSSINWDIEKLDKEIKRNEKTLKLIDEKIKTRSLLNFFRKRKAEKISPKVSELIENRNLLKIRESELKKEIETEQEILMYEVSKLANKIREDCFALQEEIFSAKELKNKIGISESGKNEKISIVDLLLINAAYDKLILILDKIELVKEGRYRLNDIKNIKRDLNSVVFGVIGPEVRLEGGDWSKVEIRQIFEKHPKSVIFNMGEMRDDLFFDYFLNNPEQWENIKNSRHIKKIFSENELKNFEKKVSETVFKFFVEEGGISAKYFEPLLYFKNTNLAPFVILNLWTKMKNGEFKFVYFKNNGKETHAYKFIKSFSDEELKNFEFLNIPGLMDVINTVLSNPDDFNKTETLESSGKGKIGESESFQKNLNNLKDLGIYLISGARKDKENFFVDMNLDENFRKVIIKGLYEIGNDARYKNYTTFTKDDFNILENLYFKSQFQRDIMNLILQRIIGSKDKAAAESFLNIFKKISDIEYFERYFSDIENLKISLKNLGDEMPDNKLIREILKSINEIIKDKFSLERINLFGGFLDDVVYLVTESKFADVFEKEIDEYKAEISNEACLGFLNQGDAAHEALEKIKEKNWITIQTYNRLYAARRRVTGYSSYAYVPKKGESHPVINVTFYGFNFPSDIIMYEENYKIYENAVKIHKNKENLKNGFASWSKEPKCFPKDLSVEKIANLVLPIGVAKNGHSHFYATPFGIVSGCVSENSEQSDLLKKHRPGKLGVNITGHREMLLDFLEREEKKHNGEELNEEKPNNGNAEIINTISISFENFDLPRDLEEMILPGNITLSEVLTNLHIEQYLHDDLIPPQNLLNDLKNGIKNNEIQVFLDDKKLSLTDLVPGNSKIIFKKLK